MSRRLTGFCRIIVLLSLVGCETHPSPPQRTAQAVPDLATVLHVGMRDDEAINRLGVVGPLTGVGGIGHMERAVLSPKFPGYRIGLDESLESDGKYHLTAWQVWQEGPVSQYGHRTGGKE